MSIRTHEFADAGQLAEALASDVAGALAQGIALNGKATLAVSGGSTPKRFFEALSDRDIDWSKVTVTLVDERFVPQDNDRSNHGLVARHLLKGKAQAAAFVPLYHAVADADAAAALATGEIAALGSPFDAVILGMGNDGHTASFFPGGNRLIEAIDADGARGVMTMEADGAGETRLTLTFNALQDARLLALHIEGDAKKATLEKALSGRDESDMPVRSVLFRAQSPVEIYWAP